MTYELAKKLKDAGFPQDGGNGRVLWKYEGLGNNAADDRAYAPTLPELIEACGDGVGVCKLTPTECNAWSTKLDRVVDDESNDFNYFRGSTPEEAVARLWLALNKK